jgi:ubiquitin-protein ligase
MEERNRLNKPLWTNMTRLKLYSKGDEYAKFILEKTPFDDEEEEKAASLRDEYVVIGKVIPQKGLYKDIPIRIEMKLKSDYPEKPPVVRLLSAIYHPNVESDGKPTLVQINRTLFLLI